MTPSILTTSVEQTLRFGQVLASGLQAGDIILLHGPLGAGKTVLVRGIVAGLDPAAAPLVTSQSYVVAGEYPTRPAVVHLDLYRLASVGELLGLGVEELLWAPGRLAVIEWPALIEPLLEPDDPVLRLELAHEPSPDHRRLTPSSDDQRLLDAVRRAAAALDR